MPPPNTPPNALLPIELMEFHPTGSGFLNPDWTKQPPPAVGGPFTAYELRSASDVQIGQLLGIHPTNTQPQWSARVGQDGYRWTTPAFPDRFRMVPTDAHPTAIGGSPTWFWQSVFAPVGAPSAPAAGDRIWRIEAAGSHVGYLVRRDGVFLRWVVLTHRLQTGAMPLAALSLQLTTPPFAAGTYSESIDQQAP